MKEKLEALLAAVRGLEGLVESALEEDNPGTLMPGVVARTYEIADSVALWGIAPAEPAEEVFCYCIEEEPELPEEPELSEETEELEEPEEPEELEEPEEPEEPRRNAGKPVFSINDRFRFIRTLFAGDSATFNSTLANVAAMDSYEEAEDLFLGEYEWNPEDPEVEAFMNVIKQYFS